MRLGLRMGLNSRQGGGGDLPSLDLAFALDRSFTTDPAAAGGALITSRRGPAAKFSRGSGATQVNADGLIEYAPENLLLRSQDQSNTATWPALNSATREANSSLGLDGTQSATKIIFSSSAASLIFQGYTAPSTVNTPLTLSIWVSSTNAKKFRLAIFGASQSYSADLTSTPTLTRYSFTVTNPNATGINAVIANESGGGAGEIVIWGAQLERASTARTYYPTTTSVFYGPRFDHDATGDCKGLLIEEPRTNLLTYSEDMTVANGWLEDAGTGTVAWENNATTSPTGLVTAEKLTEASTTSARRIAVKLVATVIGTTYTLSVYAKASERSILQIATSSGFTTATQNFDLANNVLGTGDATGPTIASVGGGWYRCSMQVVSSATGSSAIVFGMVPAATSGRFTAYTGVVGNGLFLWGAQLEAGAFPTSYIPTTSGTGIRSADVCSIIGADFSSFYNQSEGTISKQVYAANGLGSTTQFPFGFSDGTTANQLSIFRATDEPRKFGFFSNTNNVGTPTSPIRTAIINDREYGALAWAFKQNDMGGVFKGQLYTDTTITIPPVNQLHIGNRFDGARPWNGHIARIQYFRKRLPNAKLQTLTTL